MRERRACVANNHGWHANFDLPVSASTPGAWWANFASRRDYSARAELANGFTQ